MSRYIEEDHLITNLYLQADDDGFICCTVEELEEMIKAEPPADVRENKHGKWTEFCECSVCGFSSDDFGMAQILHCDFCQSCGVPMRGK